MKDLVDRINSLMNLLIPLVLAIILLPERPDSPVKLALMLREDAKQGHLAIAELIKTNPSDKNLELALEKLDTALLPIATVDDPRQITFGMINEATVANAALRRQVPEWNSADGTMKNLLIARSNLNKRLGGIANAFLDAKLTASADMVGGADLILERDVTIPVVGVPINVERAGLLFVAATIAVWLYATSILVTLRRVLLEHPPSLESFLQLRSWVGFQPWPLGPLVAFAWMIGLPICALFFSQYEPSLAWLLVCCAPIFLVFWFRVRKLIELSGGTHRL
jgi:hypothetical protein